MDGMQGIIAEMAINQRIIGMTGVYHGMHRKLPEKPEFPQISGDLRKQ